MKLPKKSFPSRREIIKFLKQIKVSPLPDKVPISLSDSDVKRFLRDWEEIIQNARYRYQQVFDKDLDRFYPYVQFSSDDADPMSCSFCKSMNQLVVPKSDPLLLSFLPPFHLGCRCRLFSVTEDEVQKNSYRVISLENYQLPDPFTFTFYPFNPLER